MAAKIIGQVDASTLASIQKKNEEEKVILEEFGTLYNFNGYLQSAGLNREQWFRQLPHNMEDAIVGAFEHLSKVLLPRGMRN
jgi:hypothetical protein